jgi:hypothetical protein
VPEEAVGNKEIHDVPKKGGTLNIDLKRPPKK